MIFDMMKRQQDALFVHTLLHYHDEKHESFGSTGAMYTRCHKEEKYLFFPFLPQKRTREHKQKNQHSGNNSNRHTRTKKQANHHHQRKQFTHRTKTQSRQNSAAYSIKNIIALSVYCNKP